MYHIAANQEVGDGFSLDQANMDIECILNILKTILGAHKSQNRYYNAIDLVVEAQEGRMLTKHRRVPETFCKDKYLDGTEKCHGLPQDLSVKEHAW